MSAKDSTSPSRTGRSSHEELVIGTRNELRRAPAKRAGGPRPQSCGLRGDVNSPEGGVLAHRKSVSSTCHRKYAMCFTIVDRYDSMLAQMPAKSDLKQRIFKQTKSSDTLYSCDGRVAYGISTVLMICAYMLRIRRGCFGKQELKESGLKASHLLVYDVFPP